MPSLSGGVKPFRELTAEEVEAKFPRTDENGQRFYAGIPVFCSQSMGARPNLCFEWRGFRNPHPSGWRLSKERLEEEYQKGNVVIRPDGKLERRKYLDDYEGIPVDDFWGDIPRLTDGNERSGYPTQKPLALYERVIAASSNPGDLVLDPFAGCATTPVAAERLGRQWVGMDIWDGAIDEVRRRMADSRQLLTDANPQIIYATIPPERTDGDDGDDDGPEVPDLVLRPQRQPERWERLSHAEMRDILATAQANGDSVVCAGCGIQLPVRYMELDHITPRKDGGENVITNRILLCGPCNGAKSANLTLSGLVRHNRRLGFEVDRGLAELAASRARDAAQRCRDTIR